MSIDEHWTLTGDNWIYGHHFFRECLYETGSIYQSMWCLHQMKMDEVITPRILQTLASDNILAIHGMSRTGSYLVLVVGGSLYQYQEATSLQLYRSRRVSSHVPVNQRSRRQSNISQNFIKIFLSVDIYCPTIRNLQQFCQIKYRDLLVMTSLNIPSQLWTFHIS